MKKAVTLLFILAFFVSCTDTELLPDTPAPVSQEMSRAGSTFEDDWESFQTYPAASGILLSMPWATQPTSTGVSKTILDDVKKQDGWNLLLHTLQGGGITSSEPYMVFHNQLTGQLKVLYYYSMTIGNETSGFWNLSLERDTYPGLFNELGDINLPASLDKSNYAVVSNLSNTTNASFTRGWEVILFNAAYNPNYSGQTTLNITSGFNNDFHVSLHGEFDSESKGTITSYTQSNPVATEVNKIATVVGDHAQNWADKEFKLSSRGLIGSIVDKIVSFGLHKVFGSFIQRFNKTTSTTQDLQFTTKTTGKISGTLSQSGGSNPQVGTFTLPAEKTKMLGNWTLKETPTIYIHPVGVMTGYSNGYPAQCQYSFIASGNYKYNLAINPELEKHIVSKKVELSVVSYMGSTNSLIPGYNTSVGDLGALATTGTSAIFMSENMYDKVLYDKTYSNGEKLKVADTKMRANLIYYPIENVAEETKSAWPYVQYVYGPQNTPYARGEHKYNRNSYRLKVTVTIVANFGGDDITCTSTRTYIPKIEWDPQLTTYYAGYGDSYLYMEADRDSKLNDLRGFVFPSQSTLMRAGDEKDALEEDESKAEESASEDAVAEEAE